MSNIFGHLFRIATWGESHGGGVGVVIDGCPPGLALHEALIQNWERLRGWINDSSATSIHDNFVVVAATTTRSSTTSTSTNIITQTRGC